MTNDALAILFWSLTPNGCVVKASAMAPSVIKFTNPPVIFESQEKTSTVILAGKVRTGDVVMIRHKGPRVGPSMVESLQQKPVDCLQFGIGIFCHFRRYRPQLG